MRAHVWMIVRIQTLSSSDVRMIVQIRTQNNSSPNIYLNKKKHKYVTLTRDPKYVTSS